MSLVSSRSLEWTVRTLLSGRCCRHPPRQSILIPSCVSVVTECSPSHFKCRSGRCVLAGKRCDGHLDCDDHSDEDNCGETCQHLRHDIHVHAN